MFVWHELQTRDLPAALAFYAGLLGWEAREAPGGRYLCSLHGKDLAGVAPSKAPEHVPAHWLPFIGTGDLEGKIREAQSLGARVVREPAAAPGLGRAAVIADPRGALFALATGAGAEPADPAEGCFSWDELLTDDPSVPAIFYAKLFSWSVEALDAGPAGVYRILRRGQVQVAGVMKHPQQVHPHWLPYLAAGDVDAMTRRALELGASLHLPAREVPGFGRFSGIDDPTGAGICLLRRAA